MRRLNLILLVVATIFLFLMLGRIDWSALAAAMLQGGRYWPLLPLPFAVTSCLWAFSWKLLLVSGDCRPSFRRLFVLRLAGESLNQLTPTASFGGEPLKAERLHSHGVSWPEATASLAIHKALTALGLVLYIVVSLALLPLVLPDVAPVLAIMCCLGTLILAGGGIAFIAVQRRDPCISFMRLLKRWGICPAVLRANEEKLTALDAYLSGFYRDQRGAVVLALASLFLGWAFHAVEVYLIFRMLGHPISFRLAFCLDGLSQLVAALGFMIPASLGVQDGGNVLLALGFNLGATLGAGFGILRRFREAFWLLVGLVAAARER